MLRASQSRDRLDVSFTSCPRRHRDPGWLCGALYSPLHLGSPSLDNSRSAWRRCALLLLLSALFIVARPVVAQDEEVEKLQKQMRALQESQAALEKEVREIRAILQGMRAPQPRQAGGSAADISIAGRPVLGRADARVVIAEFSDYQCPSCAHYYSATYPQIDREYIQTGMVRYVVKSFPLDEIHPEALKAAEAAACAHEQGHFEAMHLLLFANQNALEPAQLVKHAQGLGLDPASFQECLDSGRYSKRIQSDIREAAAGGVQGTPVFAIGLAPGNAASFQVRRVVVGAQPFAAFQEAIEAVSAMATAPR